MYTLYEEYYIPFLLWYVPVFFHRLFHTLQVVPPIPYVLSEKDQYLTWCIWFPSDKKK